MLGIIDYGAGNLGSVQTALARLGEPARFARGPEELSLARPAFDALIFPGDGHFGTAMDALRASGYDQALRAWILAGKPFLGICCGLQLLFETSEEAPDARGLSVVEGRVRRFPCRKIPQIGWNKARAAPASRLFAGIPQDSYFYYIHSFYCEPVDEALTAARADYAVRYCCAIEREALAAVQFHPEKSGAAGMALLRNWLDSARPAASGGHKAGSGGALRASDRSGIRPRGGRIGADSAVFAPRAAQKCPLIPEASEPLALNALAKRVIPCLDIDGGRVVKGVRFAAIADAGDPAELARRYNAQGADELVFLDIGASYKSRATLLDVLRVVAAEVFIPLCAGGGIRSAEDMRAVMRAGADKASVCSAALERPALLSDMARAYGSQCVVLSIDARRVSGTGAPPRWNAFLKGGRLDSGRDALEWAAEAVRLGAGEILLNSIDADGTGGGYDIELIQAVMGAVNVPVIASGGAGCEEQVVSALAIADAALAASILHFGKTSVGAIKAAARARGVSVRV